MTSNEKEKLIQEHLEEINSLLDKCRDNVNMTWSPSQRELFQAKSVALLALTNLKSENN